LGPFNKEGRGAGKKELRNGTTDPSFLNEQKKRRTSGKGGQETENRYEGKEKTKGRSDRGLCTTS